MRNSRFSIIPRHPLSSRSWLRDTGAYSRGKKEGEIIMGKARSHPLRNFPAAKTCARVLLFPPRSSSIAGWRKRRRVEEWRSRVGPTHFVWRCVIGIPRRLKMLFQTVFHVQCSSFLTRLLPPVKIVFHSRVLVLPYTP